MFLKKNIENSVVAADVVVAVLIPGAAAPKLVTKAMVKNETWRSYG